jgi:hypothetical protein
MDKKETDNVESDFLEIESQPKGKDHLSQL